MPTGEAEQAAAAPAGSTGEAGQAAPAAPIEPTAEVGQAPAAEPIAEARPATPAASAGTSGEGGQATAAEQIVPTGEAGQATATAPAAPAEARRATPAEQIEPTDLARPGEAEQTQPDPARTAEHAEHAELPRAAEQAEQTEHAEAEFVGRVRNDNRDPAPRSHDGEPDLADDISYTDLDPDARRELRSLAKPTAELVGRHLVAAGRLIDEDPELALEHARFARSRAARVALVREAAGLTAYHCGHWAEALGELRAVRRMSGGQAHLPVMADCERALGRPERALELAAEAKDLPKDIAVELKIVTAGARRDMGQLDAAVVGLQGPDLDPKARDPWSARLFYAYADNLEAAGRTEDAIRWFLNAAEADLEEETDAAERAFELREAE